MFLLACEQPHLVCYLREYLDSRAGDLRGGEKNVMREVSLHESY